MGSNKAFNKPAIDNETKVKKIEVTERNPAKKLYKLNLNQSLNYMWVIDYHLTKREVFFLIKFIFQKLKFASGRKHAIIYTKPELYNQQLTIFGFFAYIGVKVKLFNSVESAFFWVNK